MPGDTPMRRRQPNIPSAAAAPKYGQAAVDITAPPTGHGPAFLADAAAARINLSLRATSVRHLDQDDLARRWRISPRTLERWRWLKTGPKYLKVGGRVLYRLEDVLAYEAEQLRRLG